VCLAEKIRGLTSSIGEEGEHIAGMRLIGQFSRGEARAGCGDEQLLMPFTAKAARCHPLGGDTNLHQGLTLRAIPEDTPAIPLGAPYTAFGVNAQTIGHDLCCVFWKLDEWTPVLN
jgi:hypothetical protein